MLHKTDIQLDWLKPKQKLGNTKRKRLKYSKLKECFTYFLKRTPMTELVSGVKRLSNIEEEKDKLILALTGNDLSEN